MTKLKMIRATAAVVGGLTFAGGIGVVGASANPWGGYGGHDSHNGGGTSTTVTNDSNVGLNNDNTQVAQSGDATVGGDKDSHHDSWSRHSGDSNSGDDNSATTGNAKNENTLGASVTVEQNDSCGCVQSTVSDGDSQGSVKTTITNTSNVGINNINDQYALSGNATVSGNGSGGNATTGNATNSNTASISVTVKQ
jgi:hypothetical protein